MKKFLATILAIVLSMSLCVFALSACNSGDGDYKDPPSDVIYPDGKPTPPSVGDGVLKNIVNVRIGLRDRNIYYVNMYDNAAANTMLNYLSSVEMRFPTYTYNESVGFVAQSIRGSYTRNDETEIKDIKKGELYLFSGGQLRLYFKDVEDANITATPVGYFADSSNIETAVTTAYNENRGDTWGVDVYFLISKNDLPVNTDTRVKVTMNDTVVYALINDTETGKAFLELLPFHVTGYRAAIDICCSVSQQLPHNSDEDEEWNIGEIGWFGGWFTILCDNEEQFRGQVRAIIGKFEDEYINTVTSLSGNIDITVELA